MLQLLVYNVKAYKWKKNVKDDLIKVTKHLVWRVTQESPGKESEEPPRTHPAFAWALVILNPVLNPNQAWMEAPRMWFRP